MHSPPCSRIALASGPALASLRLVTTVKKPSCANFCAIAPPTPQRTPTSTSLSSTGWPCARIVLRPSDCHFEVAPITTQTCLPLVLLFIGRPLCSGVDFGGALYRRNGFGKPDPTPRRSEQENRHPSEDQHDRQQRD